jgi:hypothetical protein
MTLPNRIVLGCLLGLVFFGGSPAHLRAAEPSQEYQLKLGFLVNFARFISWPDSSFPPEHPELTVCVYGDNPFRDALAKIESKKIGDRQVRTRQLASPAEVSRCQLLYVDATVTGDRLEELTTALEQQAVVTVGDSPGFAAAGGAIEFVLNQGKLSFIINNSELRQRGIQIGSSLLNLAISVQ